MYKKFWSDIFIRVVFVGDFEIFGRFGIRVLFESVGVGYYLILFFVLVVIK